MVVVVGGEGGGGRGKGEGGRGWHNLNTALKKCMTDAVHMWPRYSPH